MKTKIGRRGEFMIPQAIRTSRRIRPGDAFEIISDEDDIDLIWLRRIRPTVNAGLVDHLMTCPVRGPLPAPARRKELHE